MALKNLNVIYCHGSENYFILIDGLSQNIGFKEIDFNRFTLDFVHQIQEIKIDGILFLLPSQQADARMRIFNIDGSEAEMCGNGFRCLGKKLWQLTGKTSYKIETLSGILQGRKSLEFNTYFDHYSVQFPYIQFDKQSGSLSSGLISQLDPDLKFSNINIGNPHLIAEVIDFDIKKLVHIGKKVNKNCKLFPDGNNLSFYKKVGKNQIFVMTYERGVGLTHSCGTAMAAVTALAARQQQVSLNQWITIYNKGGSVKCFPTKHSSNYQVTLLGNATFMYIFKLRYQSQQRKISDFQLQFTFKEEINSYHHYKTQINLPQ